MLASRTCATADPIASSSTTDMPPRRWPSRTGSSPTPAGTSPIATPGNNTPTLDQLSLGISGGVPGKRRDVRRHIEAIAALTDTKGIVLDDSADPDGLAPSLCSTKTSPGLYQRRREAIRRRSVALTETSRPAASTTSASIGRNEPLAWVVAAES